MNNNSLDVYVPTGSSVSSAVAAERRWASEGAAGGDRSGGGRGVRGSGGRSVVVFVYGGTWSSGDKSMYGMMCAHLADLLQAVVVCPNYSTYPKVGFLFVEYKHRLISYVLSMSSAYFLYSSMSNNYAGK